MLPCGFDEFACAGDGLCVPGEAKCDGYLDCADRSDEAHCGMSPAVCLQAQCMGLCSLLGVWL